MMGGNSNVHAAGGVRPRRVFLARGGIEPVQNAMPRCSLQSSHPARALRRADDAELGFHVLDGVDRMGGPFGAVARGIVRDPPA